MSKTLIRDTFPIHEAFEIVEKASEVDGEHVLAKIRGVFFVPDGESRNKRYYSRSLWEKVLKNPSIIEKLTNRLMFSTISHEQPVDEKALLDGKISHVITKLWINESGQGMGEALVLGFPAGKILNTALRAGSRLSVSTRGNGSYKGKYNGMPMVDDENFELSSIDMVLDPGFLEANASIVESLKALDINKPSEGELMDKELFEQLIKENGKLKGDISAAGVQLESIKEDNESLKKEIERLNGLMKEKEALQKTVESFNALGTVEKIQEELNFAKTARASLVEDEKFAKETGTKEEIAKCYEAVDKYVEENKKFEKEIGTKADIKKALDKFESMIKENKKFEKEVGTKAEVTKALKVSEKLLGQYKELGTPEEITKFFDLFEKKHTVKEDNAKIAALAKELNVKEDDVKELYGKVTEEVIKKVLGKVTDTAKLQERLRKKESAPAKEVVNESEVKNYFAKDSTSRLMDRMSI